MNALLTSFCVLVVVMVGAVVGSIVGKRLPEHHLSEASKEIVKFGAGFIATMAALVLGLLVASAKGSYDAKAAEMQQAGAKIILLDQILRQYGQEAKPARDLLRALLIQRQSMTWVRSETAAVAQGRTGSAAAERPPGDDLRTTIAALVPANDTQRAAQARSLQTIDDFMQMRWLFIAQSTDRVSMPLLVALAVWLTTIAFCTGLYAPRNATVAVVGLLCAVSVAAAIFLIIEMYEPFSGILRISDAPLRTALGYLSN